MSEQLGKFIKKTLWIGIVIFSIRCLISLESLMSEFSVYDIFGYIGESIGGTVLIMGAYERWIWKYNPLEDTPVLKKKYTGIIKSTYDNSERNATLSIKQSLLSIHIILTTGESKSKSISSSIDDILGEKQLTYCYLNTPEASVRERSEIHYGTAMLCVDDPEKIKGHYFTDRKSTGDMVFFPHTE